MNAHDIMAALFSHGWKISPDEQDAHELFFALMQTTNDEVERIKDYSTSLLNVSWMQSDSMNDLTQEENNSQSNLSISNGNCSNVSPNSPKNSIMCKYSPVMETNTPSIHSNECPFKGSLASHLQCSSCGLKVNISISCFQFLF